MAVQGKSHEELPTPVIKDGDALRCHCGSLLARLVPEGVEIKCRRCKRRVVIPLSTGGRENRDRAASGAIFGNL